MKSPYQQQENLWHIGAEGDNYFKIDFYRFNSGEFDLEKFSFNIRYEGEEVDFNMRLNDVKMLVNRLNEFIAVSEGNLEIQNIRNSAIAVAKLGE